MTEAQEQALLREYLDVWGRLHRGFGDIVERATPMMPMAADRIDTLSLNDDDVILMFLKRFEQFEDILNQTLKFVARAMEHGRIERLTSRDVARRAHALGILESEEAWASAVRARNALVPEYPLDPGKRTEQLNTAWAQVATLNETHEAILRFTDVEGLLA